MYNKGKKKKEKKRRKRRRRRELHVDKNQDLNSATGSCNTVLKLL
jgi:hypothetical protein